MLEKIDALIEELESVITEFDELANAENDFHVASRISFYSEHVQDGIKALRKMQDYVAYQEGLI